MDCRVEDNRGLMSASGSTTDPDTRRVPSTCVLASCCLFQSPHPIFASFLLLSLLLTRLPSPSLPLPACSPLPSLSYAPFLFYDLGLLVLVNFSGFGFDDFLTTLHLHHLLFCESTQAVVIISWIICGDSYLPPARACHICSRSPILLRPPTRGRHGAHAKAMASR